ncbi:MAG: hypothetical protein AAAC47_19665 [Pararhizobium sp.]
MSQRLNRVIPVALDSGDGLAAVDLLVDPDPLVRVDRRISANWGTSLRCGSLPLARKAGVHARTAEATSRTSR